MNILIFLWYIILALFAVTAFSFAPWVPTKKKDITRALRLVDLKPGEIFYDLGCGDGRVTFEAAKTWAHATGIELFFPLYLLCLVRKFFFCHSEQGRGIPHYWNIFLKRFLRFATLRSKWQCDNITFKCRNLFKENLQSADVVFLFGTPQTLKKSLVEKLQSELQSGARIISYVFPIPDWTPEKVCKWDHGDELSIFIYEKK